MAQQISVDADAIVPQAGGPHEASLRTIAVDVAYRRLLIANVVFIGSPGAGDRGWVLVDAGMPATGKLIRAVADERFGVGARPSAIILTHGHFDHVGALEDLAEDWDVPVYAHPLEMPYLSGRSAYPPGDASVGGGMMSLVSPLFPTGPVDIGSRLRPLAENGEVPGLPDWRWIHTPGHSVGHVSFWRERDRLLVAGDAFVTLASESVYANMTAEPEIHGPPKYLTIDWSASAASVASLAALEPAVAITGHGLPLQGEALRQGLRDLADGFSRVAVPPRGQYVTTPALASDGTAYR